MQHNYNIIWGRGTQTWDPIYAAPYFFLLPLIFEVHDSMHWHNLYSVNISNMLDFPDHLYGNFCSHAILIYLACSFPGVADHWWEPLPPFVCLLLNVAWMGHMFGIFLPSHWVFYDALSFVLITFVIQGIQRMFPSEQKFTQCWIGIIQIYAVVQVLHIFSLICSPKSLLTTITYPFVSVSLVIILVELMNDTLIGNFQVVK